jgi:tRNA(fMet)-specific endonuclease VapC
MEVRIALDTNRLTDLFRGDEDLAKQLETCEELWLPMIVLGEMKAGFYGGSRSNHNDALLRKFLAKPNVGVLLPDQETAEHYARIFVQLNRAATPIPDNDLWIAALAIQHNLLLITRDRHFQRIPQLLRG